MSIEITKKNYLCPNGRLWFIHSLEFERPTTVACNPDDPTDPNVGVVCFARKEDAEEYLELLVQSGRFDPAQFPIRSVEPGDLVAWLEDAQLWATHLIWPSYDQAEDAMIHSLPIAEAIKDFTAP